MTTGMSEKQIYEQAKKRIKQKKGFYIHLAVYICVNILLVIIWWLSGAETTRVGIPWFVFPLGGWGIAVLFHFLGVFVFGQKSDKAAVEKEAEKIKREQR